MGKGVTADECGCPQKAPPWQEQSYRYSPTMLVWAAAKGGWHRPPCLPGHLEQGNPGTAKELGRHGKSRQMRGNQKIKHEEDDPDQHHFEGFLHNSPVKDRGKWMGHCEMSGVWVRQDCTSARRDKAVGMGKTARQPGWKDQLPGSPECRPHGETTIPHKQ